MQFGASVDLVTMTAGRPVEEVVADFFDSARRADELGYDTVWVNDHLIFPEVIRSEYPGTSTGRNTAVANTQAILMDVLTLLATLSGATHHVKLGTKILVLPYRHPLLLAKMLATIDVLSGGRLVIGAGVGWLEDEFTTFGAASYEHRGALSDEYIRIFREVWTADMPHFEGRWYQFSGFGFQPKPVQPHVPIWIGGHSAAALRRAARFGDGWFPTGMAPEAIESKAADLRRLVEQHGRAWSEMTLAHAMVVVLDPAGTGAELDIRYRPDGGLWFQGSPGQLIGSIRRLEQLGISHVALDPTTLDERGTPAGRARGMEIVAREVFPAFK